MIDHNHPGQLLVFVDSVCGDTIVLCSNLGDPGITGLAYGFVD